MTLVQFDQFLPVDLIDHAAAVIVIVIVIGLVYKFRSWLRVIPSNLFKDARAQMHSSGLVGAFFSELGGRVLAQRLVFMDSKSRRVIHLVVFWGFLGLAAATVWDTIFFRSGVLPAPFSFENFGNIIGNVGGTLVLVGMTIIILRYALVNEFRESYKGDLTFLLILYLATITGFATEITRFSPQWLADDNYVVHLVFVAALLLTAPFTHFFHAVLTPFMRYVDRVNNTLAAKGINQYPFYRKLQMANLADEVRAGNVSPTYPTWLDVAKGEEKST